MMFSLQSLVVVVVVQMLFMMGWAWIFVSKKMFRMMVTEKAMEQLQLNSLEECGVVGSARTRQARQVVPEVRVGPEVLELQVVLVVHCLLVGR